MDSFSKIVGRHTFKFGGDFRKLQLNSQDTHCAQYRQFQIQRHRRPATILPTICWARLTTLSRLSAFRLDDRSTYVGSLCSGQRQGSAKPNTERWDCGGKSARRGQTPRGVWRPSFPARNRALSRRSRGMGLPGRSGCCARNVADQDKNFGPRARRRLFAWILGWNPGEAVRRSRKNQHSGGLRNLLHSL